MEIFITKNWNDFLKYIPSEMQDVYYEEEYVRLYESQDYEALCIVCKDKKNIMMLPFLRGTIEGFYDFETPYGYGGFISNTVEENWNNKAILKIMEFFKDSNYLCGFMRFHPALNNVKLCNGIVETMFDRNTVAIDLLPQKDEIFAKQISSRNRNKIRKAERLGLEYKTEYEFESLEEFISLYKRTMDRNKADKFYYFENDYFYKFANEYKGNAFLACVRKDNKLISADLIMYSSKYGHYHLGGSDSEYFGIPAHNYLLWNVALELKNNGVSLFHLGGGTDGQKDNSLFQFKKMFSHNLLDFYIGKMVFDVDAYECITERWKQNNKSKVELYGKRLLCYRY